MPDLPCTNASPEPISWMPGSGGYDAGHTGFDATRRQEDLNTADMVAFVWQTGDPYFQP